MIQIVYVWIHHKKNSVDHTHDFGDLGYCILVGQNAYGVDGAEAWLMYNGIDPNSETGQKAYMEEYERQKLNLPLFYFSILPNHYHPNVHSIPDRKERELSRLSKEKVAIT